MTIVQVMARNEEAMQAGLEMMVGRHMGRINMMLSNRVDASGNTMQCRIDTVLVMGLLLMLVSLQLLRNRVTSMAMSR